MIAKNGWFLALLVEGRGGGGGGHVSRKSLANKDQEKITHFE
jgi:hypothetical protein